MRPYETPPMLSGTMQQQMQQMREYLMRTILDMNRRDIIRNDELSRMESETTAAAAAIQTAQQQTAARPGLKLKDVVDKIYPIGSIYISASATNPRELFGGEWTQIKDRFLLAAGDTYQAGSTGGAATHTLTTDEMPNHAHAIYMGSADLNPGWAWGNRNVESLATNTSASRTEADGGSQPHNNMPPFLTVYVWQRVS